MLFNPRSIQPPLFWVDPSSGGAVVPRGAGDLRLQAWGAVVPVMYPLTVQAGKLAGKSMPGKGQLLANEIMSFVKDPARYCLHRGPLLDILARVYTYYVWACVSEGGALTPDVYEGAHALCAEKITEAIQAIGAAGVSQGAVSTLFINFRKTHAAPTALLELVRALDSYYVFSSIRSTERQKFKAMTPSMSDTPAGWADDLEGSGSVRGLGEQDILDVLRNNLERHAPRLVELMGGTVDWDEMSSVRDFLRKNPLGAMTFGALSGNAGSSGPSARRTTSSPSPAVPAFPTGLNGQPTFDSVGVSGNLMVDIDHNVQNVPFDKVNAILGKMVDVLQSLESAAQRTPESTLSTNTTQQGTLDALLSGLQNAASRARQGEFVSMDELRGLHSAFATIKPPRPVLPWEEIYPVLYPGAPVPPSRVLVGGVGWAGEHKCAACVRNRPEKTKWFSFEEASKVSEYIGSDGRLDMRKMPKEAAVLHNPGRCVQIHKDVEAYVASNPSAQWMLKERTLPRP